MARTYLIRHMFSIGKTDTKFIDMHKSLFWYAKAFFLYNKLKTEKNLGGSDLMRDDFIQVVKCMPYRMVKDSQGEDIDSETFNINSGNILKVIDTNNIDNRPNQKDEYKFIKLGKAPDDSIDVILKDFPYFKTGYLYSMCKLEKEDSYVGCSIDEIDLNSDTNIAYDSSFGYIRIDCAEEII